MKTTNCRPQTGAFTLIEMIGVLAVITILAGLILPRVYNAINDAKINSTVGAYQSVQEATTGHYAKYLIYNSLFGTNIASLPITNYDGTFLIPEALLDHPFKPLLCTNANVQCVLASACNNGAGYNFSGSAAGSSTTNGATTSTFQYVVEAVLAGVSPADANALSLAVDGIPLTPVRYDVGTVDSSGRVTYNPALNGGTVNMFVDGH